jgi:hypothetical protein
MLGVLAARRLPGDIASRKRAEVSAWCGVLVTLTQWIGVVLMLW